MSGIDSVTDDNARPQYSEGMLLREIDLIEILGLLNRRKLLILISTILISVATYFYARALPNEYVSTALLVPVAEGAQSKGLGLGSLSGLAGLAGISFGAGGSNKVQVAIEILKSRKFLVEFVKRNQIQVPLVAGERWDEEAQRLVIDLERYDETKGGWLRDGEKVSGAVPLDSALFHAISKDISVVQDKKSGFITISLTSLSPVYAKEWLEKLAGDVNQELQRKSIDQSEKNIAFLKRQIEETNTVEMQNVLYTLLEDQTKNIMLAKGRGDYVFEMIDPPVIPEESIAPNRGKLVALAACFGLLLTALILLLIDYTRK